MSPRKRPPEILLALVVVLGCQGAKDAPAQPVAPTRPAQVPVAPVVPVAPITPIPGAPTSFVELVKRVRPSVVNIHTTAIIRQRPMAVFPFGEDSPFYQVYEPPARKAQSLGTGFIINKEGDIIT